MREYTLASYDERFHGVFVRERAKLKKILPFATEVEHFGSTAVPGLKGKGILDVYVLVPKNKILLSKKKLIESRYTFYNVKRMGNGLKMVFRKTYRYAGKTRKVNLHLGTVGAKDFEKCLTFRDNLRNSKNLCREYERVKNLAIRKTKNSGEDSKENSRIYVKAKESFIKNYTKRTRAARTAY
ncbi:MAG: GrpB family protein [bacterium]|nr:GrpB family protein [bacterium]